MNYAIIAIIVILYALKAATVPDGLDDAFTIWNLRASFLAQAPDIAFTGWWQHRDYPPLLPLTIASVWRVAGVSALWPIVLHGAVLAAVLWVFRRDTVSLVIVGGVAVTAAVAQYADLPIALCVLLATVAWQRGNMNAAALALGCAMLTKNEGALIALAFVAGGTLATVRVPLPLIARLLPFAVLLAAFKLAVGAPNDVVQSTGIVDRLFDPERYIVLIPLLVTGLVTFGGGAGLIVAIRAILERRRIRASAPAFALVIVLVGYIGIYTITPHDITWHVGSSFDRLLLHLFPALVWLTGENT